MNDQVAQAEDDSPFLSMADFFSLISLTVIYVIIAFSPESPLASESIDVITGVATAAGPATQIDNDIAHVSVISVTPNYLVRVIPAGDGSVEELLVEAGVPSVGAVVEWTEVILRSHPAERVVFYMGAADETGRAHYLLHELIRVTKRTTTPVSVVFLDEDRQSP